MSLVCYNSDYVVANPVLLVYCHLETDIEFSIVSCRCTTYIKALCAPTEDRRGHISFGVDPFGVGAGVRVRVASSLDSIF